MGTWYREAQLSGWRYPQASSHQKSLVGPVLRGLSVVSAEDSELVPRHRVLADCFRDPGTQPCCGERIHMANTTVHDIPVTRRFFPEAADTDTCRQQQVTSLTPHVCLELSRLQRERRV